jgi:hypothetical protein
MKQADLEDMFKKASKSVRTSTAAVSHGYWWQSASKLNRHPILLWLVVESKYRIRDKKLHVRTWISVGTVWHWRTQWGEVAAGLQLHIPPSQVKSKKHRFYRHDYIKRLAWFTLQPKSITEIGWWLVHWNIEKYDETFRMYRLFFS